jgi:hypothetical protein
MKLRTLWFAGTALALSSCYTELVVHEDEETGYIDPYEPIIIVTPQPIVIVEPDCVPAQPVVTPHAPPAASQRPSGNIRGGTERPGSASTGTRPAGPTRGRS